MTNPKTITHCWYPNKNLGNTKLQTFPLFFAERLFLLYFFTPLSSLCATLNSYVSAQFCPRSVHTGGGLSPAASLYKVNKKKKKKKQSCGPHLQLLCRITVAWLSSASCEIRNFKSHLTSCHVSPSLNDKTDKIRLKHFNGLIACSYNKKAFKDPVCESAVLGPASSLTLVLLYKKKHLS